MHIAIVGAGMAGLACASHLAESGHRIVLFDKGRGPGGRMSTRRVEVGETTITFDHGAQYFTVRDPAFAAQVARWEKAGVVARWDVAGDDVWVGYPTMNAPIRHQAEQHDVRFGTRVDRIVFAGGTWQVGIEGQMAPQTFDSVAIAIPAEQATEILESQNESFAELARVTRSDPCWTVMLRFEETLAGVPDIIREKGPLGWAARNSAKPGRGGGECWVLQANPEWSRRHIEDDRDTVAAALEKDFARIAGMALPEPTLRTAHRWRYSRSGSAGEDFCWDPDAKLGVCGDWLIAPRVEAAFLSGRALAKKIVSGS